MSGFLPVQIRRLPLALALVVSLAPATPVRAQDASLEYAIKATYLYKFAPFIAWPSTAAAFPGGAFTICVAGDGEVAELLQHAVDGQQVSGHPIAVRNFVRTEGHTDCSVLYASGPPDQVAADLAAVHGSPVLTVTDDAKDAQSTGIINFVIANGHVRFDIDEAAAAAAGLTISSKLLSLAVHVTERSR